MAKILVKVESGKDPQTIKPKTWTYVRFDGKVKFNPGESGEFQWIVVLRVKYPTLGAPKVLRGRFVRYPATAKADETGHDDKNTGGWGGRDLHSHWSHTFSASPTMPVGFWVWHDGARAITLDGRQIKAKRVG